MVMTGKGHLRPSYNGVRDLPTRLTKSDFIGFCREKLTKFLTKSFRKRPPRLQ